MAMSLITNPHAQLAATSVVEGFKTGVMVQGMIERSDSLISYTRDCRIEPITLIDERVAYLPFLGEVLQTANSIFAGYYLQAVSLDAVIGNINVLKRLDKFNPTRSPYVHTFEDFKEGLPKFAVEAVDDYGNYFDPNMSPKERDSLTKMQDDLTRQRETKNRIQQAIGGKPGEASMVKGNYDNIKTIKDANNMAVGKLIEVTLTHNDKTLTLPIAIRLNTKTIDSQSLLHILGNTKDNKSAKERYHGWKSGELQFWRDIVFAEDLIKAHRTTLAKDKSGVYAEMMKRRNGNIVAAAMSKELSVGTASNITIISDATRKEVEYAIGGKLSDFRVRNRIFNDTYTMLLFVIDAEYEHVTIYHRGLNVATDMSVKEMKIANKNDSSMITDVLKAFVSGHAPTF